MFMMRQGDISNAKRVDDLEKRIEMLENVVNELKSAERPKVGRPPKAKDESKPQSDSPG
jgi:hypothetical protein